MAQQFAAAKEPTPPAESSGLMTVQIEHLPSVISFVLFVAIANLAAFAAYTVVRRIGPRYGLDHGSAQAATWTGIVGSLCALLFAFTIVNLWSYDRAMIGAVDSESVALRMIAHEIAPGQKQLVRDYIDATVAEWPLLCDGSTFTRSDAALGALLSASSANASHDEDLYRQVAQLDEARQQRLRAAKTAMPPELWAALVTLSVLLLVSLAFAFIEHRLYQSVLMALTATSLGVLFWLAAMLDFPFCGGTSISAYPILYALHYVK